MATSSITGLAASAVPLCVDLDGTLIRSDLLWESLFAFVGHHPEKFVLVLSWLLKGKAHLKRKLAESVDLDVEYLPYNVPFLDWLIDQRAAGRPLVLATASDEILARRVAAHLGIFDEVLASDGELNLKGGNKAKLLHERFGAAFDYAGNSSADWEIWRECREIIAVDTPAWLTRRLAKDQSSGRSVSLPLNRGQPSRLRALRLHQWIKNILIFLPIIAAHKILDPSRLLPALIAFFAFSLAASASYLSNDLVDLAADHAFIPAKAFPAYRRGRSQYSFRDGGIFGAVRGRSGAGEFGGLLDRHSSDPGLCDYFFHLLDQSEEDRFAGCLYPFEGLYTLRIVVGSEAGHVPLSGWFLSFSIFLFLSLGFAKRAAELHRVIVAHAPPQVPGRGYSATDFLPVMCFGIASAFAAALVLALYICRARLCNLYIGIRSRCGLSSLFAFTG